MSKVNWREEFDKDNLISHKMCIEGTNIPLWEYVEHLESKLDKVMGVVEEWSMNKGKKSYTMISSEVLQELKQKIRKVLDE